MSDACGFATPLFPRGVRTGEVAGKPKRLSRLTEYPESPITNRARSQILTMAQRAGDSGVRVFRITVCSRPESPRPIVHAGFRRPNYAVL